MNEAALDSPWRDRKRYGWLLGVALVGLSFYGYLIVHATGSALGWWFTPLFVYGFLPVLDYARSYAPLVQRLRARIDAPGCVEVFGLTRAQVAALRYHGGLDLHVAAAPSTCPWLVASEELKTSVPMAFAPARWTLVASIPRPTDTRENVLLYKKKP